MSFCAVSGCVGMRRGNSATIALPEVNRTVTPDFRITEKFAKLWGR